MPSRQLERGAAAGRGPGDPVEQPELVERANRVGAADDRERVRAGDRLGHRLRALREARPLEDAHRPVPEDRLRRRDLGRERLARLGADVEPEPAVRQRVVGRRPSSRRPASNAGGGDHVARQLDREAERVLVAQLLGHLAADEHGVGLAAEVAQDAELVLDLRAAGDEHERPLDLAEQLARAARARAPAAGPRRPAAARRRRRSRRARGGPSRTRPRRTARSSSASSRANSGSFVRLARVEARVLEHVDPVVGEQLAQPLAHRRPSRRPGRPPSAGRGASRPRPPSRSCSSRYCKRRQRGADARVVGDAAVLERHVQVAAHEHALTARPRPRERTAAVRTHSGRKRRADLRHQVDEPARVAPLVVVPAEDLDHRSVHHRQVAVEDRRVRGVLRCRSRRAARRCTAGSPRERPVSAFERKSSLTSSSALVSRPTRQTRSTIEPGGHRARASTSRRPCPCRSGMHEPDRARGAGRGRDQVDRCGPGPAQVLVREVEHPLVVGVRVDRRHEALLDRELVVQDLGQRRDAVRRAGGVRDDVVRLGVVVALVDAEHDRHVRVLRGRGDDHLPRAAVEVLRGAVALREEAGRLDHDVDAEVAPGKAAGVALGRGAGAPASRR